MVRHAGVQAYRWGLRCVVYQSSAEIVKVTCGSSFLEAAATVTAPSLGNSQYGAAAGRLILGTSGFTGGRYIHRSFSSSCAESCSHGEESEDDADAAFKAELLRQMTDLTNPAAWYPAARNMKRRIVAHMGPTNSGKTHHALNALRSAASGVYCGPLRLLACEVYDRLNAGGLRCHLVTGQEVKMMKGARHVASTMEMADLETPVEVAVLDEVQVVGDAGRGWAWTRALLGLRAREVHVCGDAAALPLLQQLAQQCGDELQVSRYSRLAPLVVQDQPLGSLAAVQPGDCVVAFSRRELHGLRRAIERLGGRQCSMVYGALPPESRRQQAALFNGCSSGGEDGSGSGNDAEDSGQGAGGRVLVASDAVGMGLNLNIRRVVFAAMHKFDGSERRPLKASEVKQIAGRAGRYSSAHPRGYVTCLWGDGMQHLRESLAARSERLQAACLMPRYDQVAAYAAHHASGSFADALQEFAQAARLSHAFFLADLAPMVALARLLDRLQLPPEDMYTFITSPTDHKDAPVAAALLAFATQHAAAGRVCPAAIPGPALLHVPRTEAELKRLEELHRTYDLFMWLAARLPQSFTGVGAVKRLRSQCAGLIEKGLDRLAAAPRRPG